MPSIGTSPASLSRYMSQGSCDWPSMDLLRVRWTQQQLWVLTSGLGSCCPVGPSDLRSEGRPGVTSINRRPWDNQVSPPARGGSGPVRS